MRFSANTGFLFKDRPFLERIGAAAAAGFDAVEFHDEWRHESLDDVRAALGEAGLPLLGLNTAMGETAGRAANPAQAAEARADIEEAVEAAAALGGTAVHVLAGKVEPSEEAMATYCASLAHACARAAGKGLTVLIEPLSRAAMPVYPLRDAAGAAAVIEAVGAPNLRIMFDLFHVHAEGDGILATCRAHAERIGHVQIADPETRAEPRTDGPHAIGPLLRAIRAAGYAGAFGCEYRPEAGVEAGLGWREGLR